MPEGRDLAFWRDRAIRLLEEGQKGGSEVIEANAAILDLDPSDNDARTRLAYAYRLGGDHESAEALYRQVLGSTRPNSDLHRIAQKGIALVQHERAANTRPRTIDAQLDTAVNADDAYRRASALRDARKLDLALRWVEKGLELAGRQGRAKVRRGLAVRASIYRAKGTPCLALEDARASVALGLSYDENSSGSVVLVACLVDLGELDEALEIVTSRLETDVDNRYAMNAAGRALLAAAESTGEVELLERGERCFRRAMTLKPDKPARQQLDELIRRYLRLGMTDRATDLRGFLLSLGEGAAS